MNQEFIIYISTRMLWVIAKVAGPILIVSLLVGLIIAIFQAATQIQEMTLTFIPKIVAAAIIILILGSWMGSQIIGFTMELFSSIPSIIK
ncbi:MAG: flagellar biosynthesis protein FliQ [Actinomycetota bacterium]|nr:flagellar biosynthesis protein FliQ [Actinomycetota bacterium]